MGVLWSWCASIISTSWFMPELLLKKRWFKDPLYDSMFYCLVLFNLLSFPVTFEYLFNVYNSFVIRESINSILFLFGFFLAFLNNLFFSEMSLNLSDEEEDVKKKQKDFFHIFSDNNAEILVAFSSRNVKKFCSLRIFTRFPFWILAQSYLR